MKFAGGKDGQQERLERVTSEVLESFKASEAEINAVAASGDLFRRVQTRIAAEQERQELASFAPRRPQAAQPRFSWRAWFGLHPMGLPLAAAAVGLLLLIAVTAPRWISTSHSDGDNMARKAATPAPMPSAPAQLPPTPAPTAVEGSADESNLNHAALSQAAAENESYKPTTPTRRIVHHRVAEVEESADESEELATNYLPLTLTDDVEGMSGQVVRIQLPRSALAQFGVAVSPERADELVKADVVLGDDGLARSIRLIQQQ